MDAPFVDGWQFHEELDNTWVKVTDELRFDTGHYVYLARGPLVIEGRQWFLIDNLPQLGDSDYSAVLRWDIEEDPDDGWDGWGWIAGADGRERFLEPGTGYEFPVGQVTSPPYQEPLARAYGLGDGESVPWQAAAPFAVLWGAADPAGGSCRIRITMEPEGDVLVDRSITGVSRDSEGWGGDSATSGAGEHWIWVTSGCSWSLTVDTTI